MQIIKLQLFLSQGHLELENRSWRIGLSDILNLTEMKIGSIVRDPLGTRPVRLVHESILIVFVPGSPWIPFDSEDKLESQLEGFEFARQREPVTDGIDVWGTVFELEHAHHGNIAVVILGTGE